jgi:hypothetical protein
MLFDFGWLTAIDDRITGPASRIRSERPMRDADT